MDKKMRQIKALLAKAESTEYADEAVALRAKAFELMQRYAIDHAMLASTDQADDSIGMRRLVIREWVKPKSALLAGIAKAFGCKVLRLADESTYGTMVTVVYGWESDLQMVEVLFASLEIQAMREMTRARVIRRGGNGQAFTRSFLIGFAIEVADRLEAQRKRSTADTPGTGTELVLVDRSKAVEQHVAAQNGRLRKGRGSTTSHASGFYAGQAAGQRADLGQEGLGGQRMAIR